MKTQNKFLRVFFILIACCLTTIGFSQTDKEIEEQEVRVSYMNYLHEQGYKPEVDSDGDVKFKNDGSTYYLMVRSSRVFWLGLYLSQKNACEKKMLLTLHKVNRGFLNITAAPYGNCEGVIFSCKSWILNPDDWKDIFKKSLDSVNNAYEASWDYYNEEE
tara:strand:+ start:478 stop:957 length:480 start_codon:yes stop_codon:yes gene_type:complete